MNFLSVNGFSATDLPRQVHRGGPTERVALVTGAVGEPLSSGLDTSDPRHYPRITLRPRQVLDRGQALKGLATSAVSLPRHAACPTTPRSAARPCPRAPRAPSQFAVHPLFREVSPETLTAVVVGPRLVGHDAEKVTFVDQHPRDPESSILASDSHPARPDHFCGWGGLGGGPVQQHAAQLLHCLSVVPGMIGLTA